MSAYSFVSGMAVAFAIVSAACGGGGDSYTTDTPEPEQPAVYATAQDLSNSARYCNRVNAEGAYCNVWSVGDSYAAVQGPVCFERTVCLPPTVPVAAGKVEGGGA